ncbi:MAG: hypothetical protein ACYDHH_26845 [Solirubrobacteraceae bacterium]
MRRARPLLLACLTGGALALVPGSASAVTPAQAAINDCTSHATLTHSYSVTALKDALAQLPPTDAAYTNCADVLRRQMNQQIASGNLNGKGGGGGSSLGTVLIVILIVLILGGAGATVAARRRRGDTDVPDADEGS